MKKRILFTFFLVAMLSWVLGISISFFLVDSSFWMESTNTISPEPNAFTEVFESIDNRNYLEVFQIICLNNIKVCFINIFSGVFFGIGTFVNLVTNGFILGEIFQTSYQMGSSTREIFGFIMPHSFEMIGIWISGGIGFYIAYLEVEFIKRGYILDLKGFKYLLKFLIVALIIIVIAAFVESYYTIRSSIPTDL